MDPFVPHSLPVDKSKWDIERLLSLVSRASFAVSGFCTTLTLRGVSPDIFLSPLEIKEAVLSSKIEGTVTTIDDVFKFDAGNVNDPATSKDLQEVLNYRKAMRLSKEWIEKGLPINIDLIQSIQKELMYNVRGENKHPGELRKDQVWIGKKNCKIEDAAYVPPIPLDVPIHLQNLFDYLKIEEEALIQTAFLHAQFEIIHPFNDGNGRTGRILIPLYMWVRKIIPLPVFYISEYLEANREEYIHRLRMISTENDWENWVVFFLKAVESQSHKNAEKAFQILELYENTRQLIYQGSKSPNSVKGLDYIIQKPYFTSTQFERYMEMNRQTANRILTFYKKEKILITARKSSGRTPEILCFPALYELIND